ncbi:MAG TPA: bacteriocin fulvocin C-related protein [Thermoanaerobaculia bacterium]|jgi:hypothetical protein|nr:bacteriocin fulvocin C-related protein [Thermoanaerobaculia bacterium]
MRYVGCLLALMFGLSASAANGGDRPLQRPAAPTELWITHLERFVAAHPELTEEQRAVVADGTRLLAGGLLQKVRSAVPEAKSALASFKARAASSFSKELYREAFVRLERPSVSLRAELPGGATPRIPYCDCVPNSGDCGGECVTGVCRAMPEGCGIFGTDACFGLCS